MVSAVPGASGKCSALAEKTKRSEKETPPLFCLLQSRGTPWRAPVFYPERERVLPEMEPTGRVASESATATRGAGREHIPRRARFRVTTRGRGNPTRHVGFRPRLAREELQAEFHGASARARRSRVAPRVAIARFPRAARISRLTRAANRARDRDAVRARSRRFPGGDSPPRQKSAARPNPRPRARFAAEVPARRRRERVALLGQPSRRKESRNHSSQDGSPRPPPRSPL